MSKELHKIFKSKGSISPLFEKALRNFKKITEHSESNLYHFTVGHAFKNIDKKALFGLSIEQIEKGKIKEIPNRYKMLYNANDDIYKKESLSPYLKNIRNIYAHYFHDFKNNKTTENKDTKAFENFIEQAFELACILSYIKKENISIEKYFDDINARKNLVSFLADIFYPKNKDHNPSEAAKKYNKIADAFKYKKLSDAINSLLYVTVDEEYEYGTDGIKYFSISKGKYFSFYAHLFFANMFLYKNEAEIIISKTKGFKKNDNDSKPKRDIFTFFAKKYKSEDVSSEDANLVKFRDIVQYLNKYPKPWTDLKDKKIDVNKEEKSIIENFEKNIIDKAVLDTYRHKLYKKDECKNKTNEERIEDEKVDFDKVDNFVTYFKYQFGFLKNKEWKKYNLEEHENTIYKSIIYDNEEVKALKKISKIGSSNNEEVTNKLEILKEELEKEEFKNIDTRKLLLRIKDGSLFTSYGRNVDMFMKYSCRYLAEEKYFGENTQFNMYKFYTIEEQEEYIKSISDKKTKDKLKYHRNRVTHYSTMEDHKKRYANWDIPFVIQNNCFQIKLNGEKEISIQRKIVPYLLENSLYTIEKHKNVFADFLKKKEAQFKKYLNILEQKTTIDKDEKTNMLKFFPKKLLHEYYGPTYSDKSDRVKNEKERLQKILNDVEENETIYKKQIDEKQKKQTELQDIGSEVYDNFIKKNKGLRFKMNFIYTAWKIMYFKKAYETRLEKNKNGHHKRYHITRDEYNDFCRYLFAYADSDYYKEGLENMLRPKGFYVDGIKNILKKGDFEGIYMETKNKFKEYISNNTRTRKAKKHTLNNYKYIHEAGKHIEYINASFFISYLREQNVIEVNDSKIKYKCLEGNNKLIEFYYTDKKDNSYKKLHNKLRQHKLEDNLLYEISIRYVSKEHNNLDLDALRKKGVYNILNDDIELGSGNDSFIFKIPVNKLDAYSYLKTLEKGIKKRNSFFKNLKQYLNLEEIKKAEDLKYLDYYKKENILCLTDYQKINNHIIKQSCKMADIILAMEKYTVLKENHGNTDFIIPKGKTHITVESSKYNIPKEIRNKAFHFGVPYTDNKTYDTYIKECEKKFLETLKKENKNATFTDLDNNTKDILMTFLKGIQQNGKYFKEKKYALNNYAIEKLGLKK